MSRMTLIGAPAAVLLGGCSAMADQSYVLERGLATYDALRAAGQACEARGGTIQPRPGADGRDLSGYECAIGNSRR